MAACTTTLTLPSFFVVVVGALLFIEIVTCLSSTARSINGGFSVQLIHLDSPKSPLYDRKSLNPNTPQADVNANKGQYLMKISVGTPPFDFYGIADTGSDLIWAQCVPCDGCYNQTKPMFNPTNSSTYIPIPCGSQQCHLLDTAACSPENTCNYTYGYEAGLTQGLLATETVTLTSSSGQHISLQNIVFGCGHNNTGSFNEDEMGLVGLGSGPLSLVSQIGPLFGGRKFSHCLLPFHTDPRITSKLIFGSDSEVSGDGVVSTSLVSKQDPTPYFVTLEGISVGQEYVSFNSSGLVSKGNMFLDSGTPPTILPQDFYDRLVEEVKNQVDLKPVEDDERLEPQLCYKSETILEGPMLTVHFEGGATLQLTPLQTFIPPLEGVFCFAMTNTDSDVGVYGSFAQSNFLIGFDIETMVVSFKPADCTKQ
ncbi:hypothetical protein FNV43_RR04760 [Rhamnella rubrinervis]|uniref:Peptidase A1 domain-containing protein n=1 Tax=Rhamnella rubrinervis TaxID=2594499 RepID=A0A8K0MQK6_9ROSA|nr:hypothetical protein FNV43_RR04760 [Rhamnella rubrinervis]